MQILCLRWLRISIAVAATAALVVPAETARADTWGSQSGSTGANPDANPHSYCYNAYLSTMQSATVLAMNYLSTATDANVPARDSPCTLPAGNGHTDVRWTTGDLSPGTSGQAPCAKYWPDGVQCDRYDVTMDEPEILIGSNDENDRKQSTCHELGHTVGLTHATDDCMESASSPDNAAIHYTYSTHHKSHINTWFV